MWNMLMDSCKTTAGLFIDLKHLCEHAYILLSYALEADRVCRYTIFGYDVLTQPSLTVMTAMSMSLGQQA